MSRERGVSPGRKLIVGVPYAWLLAFFFCRF